MFRIYNHNPSNSKDGADCVIRAIGKALGLTWSNTLDRLYNIAQLAHVAPCSSRAVNIWLNTEYKKVNVFYDDNGKKKRYKVKDIKWPGTYIVRVANHLTCVIDGDVYDTWDCSEKSAYIIWRIK